MYWFLLISVIIIQYAISESIHGGAFLALAGDESVLLASDTRYSSTNTGPYLVGRHHRQIFRVGKHCLVGCYGLDSDAKQLYNHVKASLMDSDTSEIIPPDSIARVISKYLYENRLYCTPVVIGLSQGLKPYVCSMDGLGAQTVTNDYAVIGTATAASYGLCESLYRKNLKPGQLVQLAENIMKLAMERDVLSGCEVDIITITKNGIFIKEIESHDV